MRFVLQTSTIKISDGKLNFIETKHTNPLTFKFLAECFTEYLKDDEQSCALLEFIKNKRTFTNVQNIKRTYN